MRLGMGEMVMILVVALLIFGPSKLPQLGDAMGKAIRGFKRATSGADEVPASREDPKLEAPR